MTITDFADFADLYRAALAEENPEKKSLLLREVRRILEEWEFRNTNDSPAKIARMPA